jgi:hypothetical protein
MYLTLTVYFLTNQSHCIAPIHRRDAVVLQIAYVAELFLLLGLGSH